MGIAGSNYRKGFFASQDCFVQEDRNDWGSQRCGNAFNEVNDLGGFGDDTVSAIQHMCGFIDEMHKQGLVYHGDFISVKFDDHYFVPATIPSHIAMFFAQNPRYGISPRKARVVVPEWVDEHPDLFNCDLFKRQFGVFSRSPEGREVISAALMTQGENDFSISPAFDHWVRSQWRRFSLVFNHASGLDCLYRLLGINERIPEKYRYRISTLKAIVDARIGYMAFADDRDPSLPVWNQQWKPAGGITPGEVIWEGMDWIETDWDHIYTYPGEPCFDHEATAVRHGISLIHLSETERKSPVLQYLDC